MPRRSFMDVFRSVQTGLRNPLYGTATGLSTSESLLDVRCMVEEASDRRRLTPKGERTRARIVEAAAALIHERGVAGATLDDVKDAAEVSGSQMYHYFPDKNDLVQAVIEYQADAIVDRNRHALSSEKGVEVWRNMVMTAAKRTKGKGGCQLGSLVGQLAESDPEARGSSRKGSNSGQPPSAMDSDPFMPTGDSRPTSTRTISPRPCSPRSKEDYSSPRYIRAAVHSKLRSIPSSPSPSANGTRLTAAERHGGEENLRPPQRADRRQTKPSVSTTHFEARGLLRQIGAESISSRVAVSVGLPRLGVPVHASATKCDRPTRSTNAFDRPQVFRRRGGTGGGLRG